MARPIGTSTMPRLFVDNCGALLVRVISAALVCSFAVQVVEAGQLTPTFESVFRAGAEPAALFYSATLESKDGAHTLQVWRDGQTRLRRKTDQAIDTYVARMAADSLEYQMIVVDYRRRITTRINRNNLIRLGHISDWFDLAHGLRHPVGRYELALTRAPARSPAPLTPCRWYALTEGQDTHHICWSARANLPMMIWSDRTDSVVWRVSEVDYGPIGDDTFVLHDAGFVRNDANADVDRD